MAFNIIIFFNIFPVTKLYSVIISKSAFIVVILILKVKIRIIQTRSLIFINVKHVQIDF